MLVEDFQRQLSVLHGHHFVTLETQGALDQKAHAHVVLGDQKLCHVELPHSQ